MRARHLFLPAFLLLLGCGETERDAIPVGSEAGFPDAGADVSVPDAHVGIDAAADADAEEDAGPACVAPSGSASVTGTTLGGPLQMGFSVFHIFGGECGGQNIVLLPSAEVLGTGPSSLPVPHVFVRIPTYVDAGVSIVAEVTVITGATEYGATGAVELTETAPLLAGSVSVDDSGVTLSGTFQAAHCSDLDVFCP